MSDSDNLEAKFKTAARINMATAELIVHVSKLAETHALSRDELTAALLKTTLILTENKLSALI